MNAVAKSLSLGRTGRMTHSPTLLFSNLIIKVDWMRWIRCINQTSLDKVPLMHLWWEGVVTVSLVPILCMACSDSSTKPSNHQWERERKGERGMPSTRIALTRLSANLELVWRVVATQLDINTGWFTGRLTSLTAWLHAWSQATIHSQSKMLSTDRRRPRR